MHRWNDDLKVLAEACGSTPRLCRSEAVMLSTPALKAAPMSAQRVPLPVESLQHPLLVHDLEQLTQVCAHAGRT